MKRGWPFLVFRNRLPQRAPRTRSYPVFSLFSADFAVKSQRHVVVAILLAFLVLAGCRPPADVMPTPFGQAPPLLPAADRVSPARLADLVNNPSAYENLVVQVSGEYGRVPQLVCRAQLHRPPGAWLLKSGDIQVRAAGYEGVLRPAAGQDVTLTVEGRWLRWRGLVGCGKEARQQEIWYLDVTRILSPNPLVFVAPAPGEAVADLPPTPIAETPPIEEEEPEERPELPEPPPEEEDDEPAATATPTPTPTPTATPDDEDDEDDEADERLTGTPTPTPTATPDEPPGDLPDQTPTPTFTPVPGQTATPTPAPSAQGRLEPELVVKGSLAAGAVHLWEFELDAPDTATISVAPHPDLNVALTLLGPDGQVIVDNQDNASTGRTESVGDVELPAAGIYQLLIRRVSGQAGAYAAVMLLSDSYTIVFPGSLRYGDSATVTMAAESDHMWHFPGTAGDSITIIITPQDNSDIFFALYGPDMSSLVGLVDSGGPGEAEGLINFTLPSTGFYSIEVMENDFARSNYRIDLTRN